jgi:hypothetical protein
VIISIANLCGLRTVSFRIFGFKCCVPVILVEYEGHANLKIEFDRFANSLNITEKAKKLASR